jgi:hypothetical protein
LRLGTTHEIKARGAGNVDEWRQASKLKNGAATHATIIHSADPKGKAERIRVEA